MNIIESKIMPPGVDPGNLVRPRLLKKTGLPGPEDGPQILFFKAPAGYGKTVLMRQTCAMSGCPFVWCHLDIQDNDPRIFLKYIAAGIKKHFPEFGKTLMTLTGRQGALKRQRQLIAALFREFDSLKGSRLIIALDDFHVLKEPEMHSFMEEFLFYLPPFVKVCIAGRSGLPFPVSKLSADGRLFIFDHDALRFTKDEIAAFFGSSVSALGEAGLIEDETEGWPLALRLMKNAASGGKSYKLKENRGLFEYLAEEALDRQPDAIRDFLLATSVLDILTPENCDFLTGGTGSAEKLAFLEKNQLFVSPLERKGAFRYHQLYREFLQSRLGGRKKMFMLKAGEAAELAGNREKAIDYFIDGGDPENAARLVIESGKQVLRQGRWQTVSRWLGALGSGTMNREPWLILFRAEVEIYAGRLHEADHLLAKAMAEFEKREDRAGLSDTLSQQARLLRSRGKYSESIDLLDGALNLMMPEEFRIKFDFSLEKSFALVLAGRFNESESVLNEALKAAEAENDGYLIANFCEALSNLYFLKGDYFKAMEIYRRAVSASPEPVFTGYYMRDSAALIYRDWGELDLAFDHARRSVAVKEKSGLTEVLPYSYYQLGAILADRGEPGAAEDAYRRSIKIAKETGGEQVFLILSLAMLSMLLLSRGRFAEAAALAEEAVGLSKSQSPYVIAFTKEMASQVMLQTGRAREAAQMLNEAVAVLEQTGAKYPLCIAYGALCTFHSTKGDDAETEEYSRKCLALAAKENYLQIFLSSFGMFRPVVKAGFEKGIEIVFVQRILARLGQAGIELALSLAASSDPEIRRRVILPMAEIGGVEARKAFQSLIDDPDPEVRNLAAQAAGRVGIFRSGEQFRQSIPLLRFDTLGAVKIYVNGTEPPSGSWTTSKARDLLVYLAHCGEAVARDRILADLWPDIEPEKSSPLFHTTLYYLRQFLNKACRRKDLISYSGGKYRLEHSCFTTDKDLFERLLNTGTGAGIMTERDAERLMEASALYKGEYLEDMDYPWLILAREHLDSLYRGALKRLGAHFLDKHDNDNAAEYLRLLAACDPLSEDAHYLLMKAYAGGGNLAMAEKTYRSLAASLMEELGMEPSGECAAFYMEIKGNGMKD